jgi:TPR repeat protein
MMYERGYGCKENSVKAYALYAKAAKMGVKEA